MGRRHLSHELLSALADGELDPAETLAATEHAFSCGACATELESLRSLDASLRTPPAIACAAAAPLLSARLDGELSVAEAAIVEAHLAACRACSVLVVALAAAVPSLSALPSGSPSAHVDQAIAALTRRPAPRIPRTALLGRAFVAVTAALVLVLAGLTRGAPVATQTPPANDRVLVAAAQQVVLNPRTNTLYVLDPVAAAVDARDASTNDLKERIDVGGQPTALALNEAANTVLVLDASLHRVTEIDSVSNRILSATQVAVSGTPTTISVDPSANKILVTASTVSGTPGSVAVIDGTTKQVESVRDFTVAPDSMVFSVTGDRAAVVSSAETTILDSTYKPIGKYPGGIAAAFAQGDDRIAILSRDGADALVTYVGGRTSPLPLKLTGSPRAITSLPDGGFLVLLGIGADRSRVSHVAPDGHEVGSVELAVGGRDIVYDAKSRRFSVANGGQVLSSDVPQGVVAAATTAPSEAPQSSAPAASPSASAAPTASASPSASTSPQPSETPRPIQNAAATPPGFTHVDLPGGRLPFAVAKSGETLLVLDDKDFVESIDLATGNMSVLAELPGSAQIAQFIAGTDHLYALDTRHNDLYVVTLSTARVATVRLTYLKSAGSVTVGSDDDLWTALADSSLLIRFDPRTSATQSFDLAGAHVSQLASDPRGGLYYADDARNAIGSFNTSTGRITEVAFVRHGVTTSLVVDGSGTLWLGNSSGEIWSVRGGTAVLSIGLQWPVTTLTVDANGRAWYLAPVPQGAIAFGYGTADGLSGGRTVSGPAFSLSLGATGHAWLGDPRGGFYVSKAEN